VQNYYFARPCGPGGHAQGWWHCVTEAVVAPDELAEAAVVTASPPIRLRLH
jgi:hypothetical protein